MIRAALIVLWLCVTTVAAAEEPAAISLILDLEDVVGSVRALNGVQSGPLPPNSDDPILTEAFRAARVRLVRLPQDLGFGDGYEEDCLLTLGDIFPDAEADLDDPASYRFHHLDQFISAIRDAGAEPLWQAQYDIGRDANAWAPNGQQGGRAPRDPARWTRVIVNVLRHLNDGWADGHAFDVRYVEFPNEPCGLGGYDCDSADGSEGRPGRRRLYEDFARLVRAVEDYNVASGRRVQVLGLGLPTEQAHRTLPELKSALGRAHVRLPIFSYHDYAWPPELGLNAHRVRSALDAAGLRDTPVWNTEWNWPMSRPAPEDLRGLFNPLQHSAYVAAHNVQAKTLAQGAWDEAIVYRAIRGAASSVRRDPDEFAYFFLDHNRQGIERGTPKPAYHTWRIFEELATRTPLRLRVTQDAETPTLLAARSNDGRRVALLAAHFCPSHASGCADRQPYRVLLRGAEPGARYAITTEIIDGNRAEPSIERRVVVAGEPGLPITDMIALWSVRYLIIEPEAR